MLDHMVRLWPLLFVCAVPRPAQAWNEPQVSAVSARLNATELRRTQVTLDVSVRVSEAWLSRFELSDLDRDLVPSGEPAEFIDDAGVRYLPAVTIPTPGLVAFEFANKREAPQRGDYHLRFGYATRALTPRASDGVSRWSLPRWPNRLAGVEIRVLTAAGMRPHASDRAFGADAIEVEPIGRQVEMLFKRFELPRTQAFAIELEPPPMAADAATRRFEAPPPSQLSALALGLAIALLWSLKRHTQSARPSRPLLPLMAAKTWSGLLCAGAVALFDRFPIAAAISGVVGSALSFEVIDRQAAPPTRSLSSDWLDATTPLGIAVALASAAGVACLHRQTGVPIVCPAILAAPIFLSANRRLFAAPSERDPAAISGRVAQQTQLAFLRKSSITLSRSFNSRATTSGCGSKSTSADCSSS